MAIIQNASVDSLGSILHGCCGFFDIDGRTTPVRFLPEQLEFYRTRHPDRYNAALACAGLYLEFTTDAEEISFDYSTTGSYVTISGIDVYENGEFMLNTGKIEENVDNAHFSYKRKSSVRSTIKIYFPAGVRFFPCNFCLGDAQPVPKRDGFIMFYGDSITQSAYINTPSLTFAELVADSLGCEYLNRGVGSFIFDAGSLPSEPDCSPSHVFVEYGLNDLGQFDTLEVSYAAADAYIAKLKKLYPRAKIHFILPNFTPKETDSETIRTKLCPYTENLAAICAKYNVDAVRGELLLLCSDGLVVTMTDEEMFATVRTAQTMTDALERLLALSREHGAPDNVTAVLLGDV